MNDDQLKNLVGKHIKLRPVAKQIDQLTKAVLERFDDRWFVKRSEKEGLVLELVNTGHVVVLPFDHIREFISDTDPSNDGFLLLDVQLHLSGELWLSPDGQVG